MRETKENSVRDGKFRRFASLDAFALATTTTRNEGEVVGREMPRGRRSTDCNVARNYVSAVSTADIPPSSPRAVPLPPSPPPVSSPRASFRDRSRRNSGPTCRECKKGPPFFPELFLLSRSYFLLTSNGRNFYS